MDNDKPMPRRMTRFQEVSFRAGIMGFPFCVAEYYFKREPIFLLGGGFFAALFFTGFYTWWKLGRPALWKTHDPGSKNDDR
jgi:hypothetical protein